MDCENCYIDVEKSAEWFYSDYKTDLLLSFVNKLNRDIIYYISKYLIYIEHCIIIQDKHLTYNKKTTRILCTGCFQKGMYKYSYSGNTIIQTPTITNDIQYFYNYIQKEDRIRLLKKYKKYFFPKNYYLHYHRKNPIVNDYVYISEL